MARRGLEEYAVIPVHPFQWDNVIAAEFAGEIATGEVVLLGVTATAEPLMSVRTLRVSDGVGAMHIKVAVEIQLTGAVRGISAGAVAAPPISEEIGEILSLDTGFNPRTCEDAPGFDIARDVAAIRWAAGEGLRAHCFGAVLRTDPAAGLADDEVAMPVATLISRNPLTGNQVLADLLAEIGGPGRADEWFAALGRLLFVPAAALLARWGVAVEPHPQNTVVVLREGMPTRVVVRDLGGCRIFTGGPLGGGDLVAGLRGTALVEDDLTRVVDKVFYPLVANLYRHLQDAAALAEKDRRRVDRCIAQQLADEYRRTRAAGADVAGDRAETVFGRLLGEVLPVKRVLGMRLSGAVTEQDYIAEVNPLAGPDLLGEEDLRERIDPWRQWADRELRRRVDTAAAEEGLGPSDLAPLEADLDNAAENLALVRAQVARRVAPVPESYWDLLRSLPPHEATATADSLGITGHNVHPLAKLRRGFSLEESAAFGPESGTTVDLRFVGVARGLLSGADAVQALLEEHFPGHLRAARRHLERARPGVTFDILPVHPWQLRHVIADAYADERDRGDIVVIPQLTLAARPTISLRTLIPHAPGASGQRPFLKCAVDVVLTSTRRSISQDSALGTPRVAALVAEAVEDLRRHAGLRPRVSVVPEVAGAALARGGAQTKARQRGLSVLLRDDTAPYLRDGEVAVSASALRGHDGALPSPLADIAPGFFDDYVYDLVATVFGLMFFHGIALEQHLQNTMVRIDLSGDKPAYRGLLLRDFSGLRALEPRLRSWGADAALEAFEGGAMTLTCDYEEFLNKGFYACVFGNLDGIVGEYAAARGCDPEELWGRVRVQIERVCEQAELPIPEGDAAWIRRPTIRRKGFLSMGLTESGADIYLEQPNPLVGASARGV